MPGRRFSVRGARGLMVLLGLSFVALGAGTASADDDDEARADLTGCIVRATATDPHGATVSRVSAPTERVDSPDYPFVVDYDGTVSYQAKANNVITDHRWKVAIDGVTVASGGSRNLGRKSDSHGAVEVKRYLPIKITGLYHVSGDIVGTGGYCEGSVWVKLSGNPATTTPFWGAIGLILFGTAGVAVSRPSGSGQPGTGIREEASP